MYDDNGTARAGMQAEQPPADEYTAAWNGAQAQAQAPAATPANAGGIAGIVQGAISGPDPTGTQPAVNGMPGSVSGPALQLGQPNGAPGAGGIAGIVQGAINGPPPTGAQPAANGMLGSVSGPAPVMHPASVPQDPRSHANTGSAYSRAWHNLQ